MRPSHAWAGFQGWILGSHQLHLPPDEKPCGADQPPWLGEETRGAAENAGERRGGRQGLPACPRGRPHPAVPPQRNGTVAGRLAAEAQALWQMQNSTVQSQEALVVSPCQGWWLVVLPAFAQWCPCERGNRASAPFSPPCPAGKAGGKRPVPLPLGATPPGTCAVSSSSKKYVVPYGSCLPVPQKASYRLTEEPGKTPPREDWSPLVLRFAAANHKHPCSTHSISASRAEPSHSV